MNLSKFFSNARTRVMCALASLTMIFGVGAAVNAFVSTQQNEVVETKAAASGTRVYLQVDGTSGGQWGDASAKIAMWHWNGNGAGKLAIPHALTDSNMFFFEAVQEFNKILWVRLDPNTSISSGQTNCPDGWNKSGDIDYQADRVYVANGFNGSTLKGSWGDWTRTIHKSAYVDGVSNPYPSIADQTLRYGDKLDTISDPAELYGYTFDGWYWNTALTNALVTTDYLFGFEGVRYLYAKYSRLSTNKTYYVDLTSCQSKINGGSAWAYCRNDSLGKDAWPNGVSIKPVSGIANLYSFSVPVDADYFVITSTTDGTNNPQKQTANIALSSQHNLYKVTTNHDGENQTGEWKDVSFRLGGYFAATSYDQSGWGSFTYLTMHEPTDSSGNQAELTGVAVSAFCQLKVNMIFGDLSGTPTQMWYGHCEEGYSFLDYTGGRTNNPVTKSGDNDGFGNVWFKTAGTYSFYLKGGVIYIEDDSNKETAGYLYFSNAASADDIHITAINNADVTKQSSVRLSSIAGTKTASNLTFNSIRGMHRISMYNLRGNDTSHWIKELTINDGTSSQTYTWGAATTGEPKIYIDLSSNTKDDSTKGPAAKVAFDFALAVSSAGNSSVCNITQATARSLCNDYDDLTAAQKTSFEGSFVNTWNSSKPTYADSFNWSMTKILYQVSRIAADGKDRGTSPSGIIPSPIAQNQSPLTLTLWIVLGCGVLGLGAIGTAYFVSKKKKRNRA